MTCFIIGCGPSAENWFLQLPYPMSGIPKTVTTIGVNDCLKFGIDTDYLLLIDSLNGFKKEPERVKTISRSKAKILTHGDTWKKIFPKYEVLRLQGFTKHLNKKHVYSSKSSPFVALSYAYNLGATDIVMFGVDLRDHPTLREGSKILDYELRNFEKINAMMRRDGTVVWVSSGQSRLSDFLPIWSNSFWERAIEHSANDVKNRLTDKILSEVDKEFGK